jgi:hypothetical protein
MCILDAKCNQAAQGGVEAFGRLNRDAGRGNRGRVLALHYVDDLEAAKGFDEGADLRVGGQRSTDNGDYVAFREHLTDSSVPRSGVLVEMQVYRRGQGRTFAQPRAYAGTRRWSCRHRS